ncbi:TSC22 domain family protein 1-like [Antennarius striatus]|uniref:TSC22 domain family protein 1-like n=1 Tax=Antennarius striatus TaxID=241820 RepID=UPI0035B3ABF7
MHHQDFSGDPTGTGSRKAGYHYRGGSSGAPASSAAGGGGGVNPCDDNPIPAGSSSPALHHQPPSQAAGAQVKKKSGFQITSVTSAQINVSGNNSLADDTESYDDMDESHTEDLSSSDMLDVSMSRATDTGIPPRSSSDETLNSLHGVDSPGIVSPNEPLHPHSIAQGSQQHTAMVNGTMHHHYYLQQHSQTHLHHSDSAGGGELLLPTIPIAPLVSSTPAMVSKAGPSQSQRAPKMDNIKTAGGTNQPLATVAGGPAIEPHQQGSVNISNVSAVTATVVPPSGPTGFDNTSFSGQVASVGRGTGPSAALNTQTQHTHTQTVTGSRFRVVKLDTNSEPFRKGRWTCTEYYEKEIPPPATAEAPKGAEAAAEPEGVTVGTGQGASAVQPPHTLQPYQQPSQDFTSPKAIQSPPQGSAQTTPLTYVSPQEVVAGAHMQKPVAPATLPTAIPQAGVGQPPSVISQQLAYVLDPNQAPSQGSYPAPQLHSGVMAPGGIRQPDFIQPTAPFQTQVQPPLPHASVGISGTAAQPPAQPLPHQAQGGPPALTSFGQPQTQSHPARQVQPPSTATVPTAHTYGTPYMPLTAVLQPLLAPGAAFTHVPGGGGAGKSSQLEDAQRLLLQHQGLLGLPRLGGGGDGAPEGHMGMSAEASAFMAAAAAGLRTQHAEGEEDSSSGASVVAIDNKIEQAMDLVKSHLMYAVREEVEVLKEQIKELIERNTQLEQENNLLKNLASPEQMAQFQAQVQTGGSPTGAAQPPVGALAGTTQALPSTQNTGPSA